MSNKVKTTFFCQNCGTQHAKWLGQCNSCQQWNTIVEEVIHGKTKVGISEIQSPIQKSIPKKLSEIKIEDTQRFPVKNSEFNEVLGGGVVPGSVILLGGEPGIGKSTLSLQIAMDLQDTVLYVSGEESLSQIKLRAERITESNESCLLYAEIDSQKIIHAAKKTTPRLIVIDSIQTIKSPYLDNAAGSISQIRESAQELIQYAKESQTPVIIIGHINKDGHIAGPKVLEHMVDVVLQFEGDRHQNYRILRAKKNRFGSTHELGIFEMEHHGLREIKNPSEILLNPHQEALSGTSVAASIEGIRPMMVEIQALVSSAVYGTPQRSSTGFNNKRLNMLLAVLEKRMGFKLGMKDVFLNITGGIKIEDPALDLAVAASIMSSDLDVELPYDFCFSGEIGLSGEIRPVSKIDKRIQEAKKLGFKRIFVAPGHNSTSAKDFKIVEISKIQDLIPQVFQ